MNEPQGTSQSRLESRDVARMFDVPPWLVDPGVPVPRFPRLRWRLRRVWPLADVHFGVVSEGRVLRPWEVRAGMLIVETLYEHEAQRATITVAREARQPDPSETEELEAALWALTIGGWDAERASLYDEEGVEGWEWTGPRSVDGHAEIGDWYDLPPVPDVVVDAYRAWKAGR